MRLGILDCDRLDPDLVGILVPFTPRCLSRVSGRWPRAGISGLVRPRRRSAPDLTECDAWLITGSRHDAYSDIPWILALRDWIRRAHDANVKLAGVCFGHQVIAQALGGR